MPRSRTLPRLALTSVLALAAALAVAACSRSAPVTVEGRVVGSYGAGVPGLVVVVAGHDATTTDAEGRFRIEGVTTPYDLAVASVADAWLHRFDGLREPAPVLVPEPVQELTPAVLRQATLTGALPGALPSDERVVVCAHGASPGVRSTGLEIGAGGTQYGLLPTWIGPTEADVTVRAVHYRVRIDGTSDEVLGVATMPHTVQDGVTVHDTVTFGPVSSSTLDPDVVVPFGFGSLEILVASVSAGEASFQRVPFASTGPLDAVPVPAQPDMTYLIASSARGSDGARLAAWQVDLPLSAAVQSALWHPATLESPADGASVRGPSTVFRFAPGFDGTHTIVARPATVGAGPTLTVSTRASQVTLPDPVAIDASLAALGWPPAEPYLWHVESFTEDGAPVAVERAMEGRLQVDALSFPCGRAPTADGHYARSGTRAFTSE